MTTTSQHCPAPPALERAVAAVRAAKIDLDDKTDMTKGRKIATDVIDAVMTLSSLGSLPVVLNGEPFVAGSFGRRTQAQPLDDIDIFIPLDAASLALESPANHPTSEQLVSVSSTAPLGCRSTLQSGPWLDSGETLDSCVAGLHKIALAGVTNVGKNPRGRCAHLTYGGINVDLVFVLWSKQPNEIDRYHLPSGADWTWKTANPKDDQARLTRDNQDLHGGLLLPTIRAMKAWNDHACGGRLKSIHLEVLLLERIFANTKIDSVVSALTCAFEQLPAALSSSCPDPTRLGPDLDASLPDADREWMQAAATSAAADAAAANKLATGDLQAATARWEAILLTQGAPAPKRAARTAEPGRHDGGFGQPAHHCTPAATVPPPKAQYRPVVPVNQQGRSGKYA